MHVLQIKENIEAAVETKVFKNEAPYLYQPISYSYRTHKILVHTLAEAWLVETHLKQKYVYQFRKVF